MRSRYYIPPFHFLDFPLEDFPVAPLTAVAAAAAAALALLAAADCARAGKESFPVVCPAFAVADWILDASVELICFFWLVGILELQSVGRVDDEI